MDANEREGIGVERQRRACEAHGWALNMVSCWCWDEVEGARRVRTMGSNDEVVKNAWPDYSKNCASLPCCSLRSSFRESLGRAWIGWLPRCGPASVLCAAPTWLWVTLAWRDGKAKRMEVARAPGRRRRHALAHSSMATSHGPVGPALAAFGFVGCLWLHQLQVS